MKPQWTLVPKEVQVKERIFLIVARFLSVDTRCSPGTYLLEGTTNCEPCQDGQFQNGTAQVRYIRGAHT